MIRPVLAVMLDLWREAMSRKWFMALGIAITLLLTVFTFSLQLDVVDGALAGTKLFGKVLSASTDTLRPADQLLGYVFQGLTISFFYLGALFLCFACADFGPTLLKPGRIEHLLSLPLQRWQLLLGTYLGVVSLTSVFVLYAAAGSTLLLGLKSGVWTWTLVIGAGFAWVGFAAIYAAMLTSAVWVRSAALSGAVGLFVLIASLIASWRAQIEVAIDPGLPRTAFMAFTALFPRLALLPKMAAELATGGTFDSGAALRMFAGCLTFAAALLAVGTARFENRDY